MKIKDLPKNENIYETKCPILYAMEMFGQKWKLPILWYIADGEVVRYNALQRKVVGITPTMLTKCLRELETDGLISRTQYNTIPPTVEYRLTARGKSLIPALESVYRWAQGQMTQDKNDSMNDQ
ncbi:MAG: helix-turn-helix transcriptional regulator [Clostridia bacterium]|nr:helix-turn-helix transcriptional regulator [Clostridia bacterium]